MKTPTSLEMTKKSLRKVIPLHQWIRKERTHSDKKDKEKHKKNWLNWD